MKAYIVRVNKNTYNVLANGISSAARKAIRTYIEDTDFGERLGQRVKADCIRVNSRYLDVWLKEGQAVVK